MIEELLSTVARCLDERNIPHMIIGGQAVLVYGSPRLTRDIAITLGITPDKYALVKAVCVAAGLRMLPKNPRTFAEETMVLPAEDIKGGLRVDFIFSGTPYEETALRRVRKIVVGGYPIKFASPEDVIIHKMIAGRAVDEEDVKNILIKLGKKVDSTYIQKWLSEFEAIPEHRAVTKKFKALLKQLV